MTTFSVRDGQFWLDDRAVLIQAGEFHYFRTPVDQWRHRLGLLQQSGFNALATYIPWLWHEPSEDVFDVTGHSHPMRDLAGFLDLATEMGFWIIARPGPYIMAETHNEGIPQWLFERYPQVAYVDQNGRRQNIVSYLHPDYLDRVGRWYRAVFEVLSPRQVTRGGRIVLIQLDNEMGMIQWVRNIFDTNTDTLTRLSRFVKATYGDHLKQRYSVRPTPIALRRALTRPKSPDGRVAAEDYRRFYRPYLREYLERLWDQARACGMDVPPVVNIHGFGNGGKTFPIGLSQLVDVMALPGVVSATDVYPIHIDEGNFAELVLVNEMTRALHNPDQALFSIEFQSGGFNDFSSAQCSLPDLHTRLCLSVGMRAINHYLFCSGENFAELSNDKRHDWGHPVRPDGTTRRPFARYARLSRALAAYGQALIDAQPEPVTTVGFVLDHFMTEVNNAQTRERSIALTQRRDTALFDMIGRGLALTQRAYTAIELERGALDPVRTPALWVSMAAPCSATVQHKLVGYLQAGGKLALVGQMCREDADQAPCTVLADALGITGVQPGAVDQHTVLTVLGHDDVPVGFYETYGGSFDEVIATDRAGRTVGFAQRVGQGQALVLGTAVGAFTLDDLDLVTQMARRLDCPTPFALSEWVDVRLSRGPSGSFLYLNNYQDDPIETTVAHRGQALFNGRAVHVPARQGVILPLEWQAGSGVSIGFATSEIVAAEVAADSIRLATALPAATVAITAPGFAVTVGRQVEVGADGGLIVETVNCEVVLARR